MSKPTAYELAENELRSIGKFVPGADQKVVGNEPNALNNTLVFNITNPTTTVLPVNLFNLESTTAPTTSIPPPSILQPFVIVGLSVFDAAFCPTNGFIYVADNIGNAVFIIDSATNTVLGSILLPGSPNAIIYNPVNNQIYVGYVATVSRIDCATNTIVGPPIVLGALIKLQGMAYNSTKNSIYVGVGAIGFAEIDCITNVLVGIFPTVGAANINNIAINPNFGVAGRAYISDTTNNVFVIDCFTNATILSIPSGVVNPKNIQFCPFNSNVYVCGQASNDLGIIDTLTNLPGVPLALTVTSPDSLCYNPINNLLYVTGSVSNNFDIVDVPSFTTGAAIPLDINLANPITTVYNSTKNSVAFFSDGVIGFGAYQEFLPIAPPQPIVVLNGNLSLANIFNDLLGKPVVMDGLRMITNNFNQFANNITIQNTNITGKVDGFQFQPLNYVSPTNRNQNIIDVRLDFSIVVSPPEGQQLVFNIEPLTKVILSLKISSAVDDTDYLEKKDITKDWGGVADKSTAINRTGNPIVDIVMENEANKILAGESGFTSLVQYAFYPHLTGNPVADIALLNSAGFKDDHS